MLKLVLSGMIFALSQGKGRMPCVQPLFHRIKFIGGIPMRVTGKLIWPFLFAVAFITLSRVFIFGATPAQTLNLPEADNAYVVEDDDETPDVTARVARISFLKGDAQIKRADGGDWEKATLNLPLVEGDEITTSAD